VDRFSSYGRADFPSALGPLPTASRAAELVLHDVARALGRQAAREAFARAQCADTPISIAPGDGAGTQPKGVER